MMQKYNIIKMLVGTAQTQHCSGKTLENSQLLQKPKICATIDPIATLMEKAMKEVIFAMDKGETRADESRDCTVRALANAAVMDYNEAHELLAYYGRPSRRGAKFSTMFPAYADAGFSKVKTFGTTGASRFARKTFGHMIEDCEEGITLKNFCKKYNKGRYIVVYLGHALAVVNGQVIDTFNSSANKRVVLAFSKP